GYLTTKDRYKFRVTEHIVNLMERTDDDGLRRQFLPDERELVPRPGEYFDVAAESEYSPVLGIVHRYPGKVLLLTTLNCPAYCRFCFRKEKLNDRLQPRFLDSVQLDSAFRYIADQEINEVILSGGDPLYCSDAYLADIVSRLQQTSSVRLVRYHTR